MRYLIYLFLLLNLPLIIDQKTVQAEDAAEIFYTLSISDPSSHMIEVEIRIKNLQAALPYKDELLIRVHDSAGIDDYLIDFTAKDSESSQLLEVVNAHFNGSRKNIRVNASNDITINYILSQEFQEETYIDINYAILFFHSTLFKPHLDEEKISRIELIFNRPPDWQVLTTLAELESNRYQLSSLDDIIAEKKGPTGGESLIAGLMSVRDVYFDDIHLRLAIFRDIFDDGFPITMDRFEVVVQGLWVFYERFFGGSPSKTPTVALTPFRAGHYYGNNMVAQCYSGWDSNQSSVGITYPWNLTHHMAHAWWINELSADPGASAPYYMIKEGFNTYINLLSMQHVDLWQERIDAWYWNDPIAAIHTNLIEEIYYANFCGYRDNVFGTPDDHPLSGSSGHPSLEKAVSLARILDYRIQFLSDGNQGLSDLFAYLFTLNGGHKPNNNFLVDADVLLSALNHLTRYDFTEFFDRYVFGLALLPYEGYYLFDLGKKAISDSNLSDALNFLFEARGAAISSGENELAMEADKMISSISSGADDGSGDGNIDNGQSGMGSQAGSGGGCFITASVNSKNP